MKYIASVSWGKDSLAMLIRIINESRPLDEVVFYDTGMEFNAIYEIRNTVVPILKANSIKYTELRPEQPFEYTMFEKPVNGKKRGALWLFVVWWALPVGNNRKIKSY